MLSIIISCLGRKDSGGHNRSLAGARNLEDTGARTKSPLSGAGKTNETENPKPQRFLESAATKWWLPDGKKVTKAERWCFFVWKVEAGFCAILRFCLSKKCHNWCKHGRIWWEYVKIRFGDENSSAFEFKGFKIFCRHVGSWNTLVVKL